MLADPFAAGFALVNTIFFEESGEAAVGGGSVAEVRAGVGEAGVAAAVGLGALATSKEAVGLGSMRILASTRP